jgi:hypothetical protein
MNVDKQSEAEKEVKRVFPHCFELLSYRNGMLFVMIVNRRFDEPKDFYLKKGRKKMQYAHIEASLECLGSGYSKEEAYLNANETRKVIK